VPGRQLLDNNWLSQLVYYGLYSLGGLELVQFVNSLTLAAAVVLLLRLCRTASGSMRIAGGIGVVVFLGLWQTLLIRPQSYSVLLFVLLYDLLLRAWAKPFLLGLAPPLMALWANVHGGFAVGLLLLLVFAAPAYAPRRLHPRVFRHPRLHVDSDDRLVVPRRRPGRREMAGDSFGRGSSSDAASTSAVMAGRCGVGRHLVGLRRQSAVARAI